MSPSTSDFFYALLAGYPPDEELRLEIRCLVPAWNDDLEMFQRWYILDRRYLTNAAVSSREWAKDYDVYFGVLPRWERSGNQEGIHFAGTLFADVDGGLDGIPGAIERIRSSNLPHPHIAVRSGGGLHCYWFLADVIALPDHHARERFKSVLRRLCRAIGGEAPAAHADLVACEAARVLRVPNTINHKIKENPRAVEIVHCRMDAARLTYEEWRIRLPVEPAPPWKKEEPAAYTPAGFVSDGLQRWAKEGYPEGNRHRNFVGAAAWLIRDCKLAKVDALALLRQKAALSPGRRSITEQEIEALIQWA